MSNCIEILIVEDDPGDTLLALEVLSELSLNERSLVLSSAEEAMDFLRARGRYTNRDPGFPQVILLDLKMPGMDGFALLEELKRDAELSPIPVMVLSSSDEHVDVERARSLGASGYLVKGVDFASYRAALHSLARYQKQPGFLYPGSR
jgi:two-component system, response regulator